MVYQSAVLGDVVIIVANGREAQQERRNGETRVIYTRAELAALKGLPADALKAIHAIKKGFAPRGDCLVVETI